MKSRSDIVDLWRFLGCMGIMIFHSSFLGIDDYPFRDGWIYVEFFYILSGYFTMKHFDNNTVIALDKQAKEAIVYSLKKYKNIIMYTSLAFLLKGISRLMSIFLFQENIDSRYFSGLLLDALLIIKPLDNLGVLWFVQALLIVFPLFCLICQTKYKNVLCVLSFLYVIIFYYNGVSSTVVFPGTLFRCMGGLLLGVLVYFVSEIVKDIYINNITKVILTVIEQGLLILTFVYVYFGQCDYKMALVCFFIGTSLMVSKITYTNKVSISFFNYLGKLSLIVYIFHSLVPAWLSMFGICSLWIYIMVALILSNAVYFFYEIIKRKSAIV